jgi:hypothetical protein
MDLREQAHPQSFNPIQPVVDKSRQRREDGGGDNAWATYVGRIRDMTGMPECAIVWVADIPKGVVGDKERDGPLSDPPIWGEGEHGTGQRLQTVTTRELTIMTETATMWIGNSCMTLTQRTSLVPISAFPHYLSFPSSSPDLQGECEGDNDDGKDNKGSKHSKE